jgi:hypothetical protein
MTKTVTGTRYLPGTYAQKRTDTAQRAQHFVRQLEQKEDQKRRTSEQMLKSSLLAPTICFSRKIGVGALEIAELLAQKTGHRVADRLIIEKIADDADLGSQTVKFFDERHPGQINQIGAFLFGEKSFVMGDSMRRLASAVLSLAEAEATTFVGRGAHLILPRDRVLAVRCISSIEYRIKRVADILGVSEDSAKKELDEADKEQRRFFQRAFGKKDASPYEFDLVINRDFINRPEWAADIIYQAYLSKFQMA